MQGENQDMMRSTLLTLQKNTYKVHRNPRTERWRERKRKYISHFPGYVSTSQ